MSITHARFDARFIWASLAMALLSGFPLGAWVLFSLSSAEVSLNTLLSLIQLHGHIQLVGWVGLFIVGVSLFFIPRFLGVPLRSPRARFVVLVLVVAGLLSQMVARILAASAAAVQEAVIYALALGGAIAEWGGIVAYVLLVADLYRRQTGAPHESIRKLKPYFLMVFSGWILFVSLHVQQVFDMVKTGADAIVPAWHQWNVDFFIAFVLFPITYAFSVRTFSLFLQLPITIRKAVHIWGVVYLVLTVVALSFWLPPFLILSPEFSLTATYVARIARTVFMLWMVWQLDLFYRRGASPWVPLAVPSPNPPRKGLADAGEFGRFEWAIYSAYAWLVVSLGLDLMASLEGLTNWGVSIAPDPIRHAFLLGFVTLLIIGMASRMLPGFMHKKRIAHPALVAGAAVLGNGAVLLRVVPAVLPDTWDLSHAMPWAGILGMGAVGALGWNLAATYRLKESAPPSKNKLSTN